jgi:hypothetical protein
MFSLSFFLLSSSWHVEFAKYAARNNGLTDVPVIHGNAAVVTMVNVRLGRRTSSVTLNRGLPFSLFEEVDDGDDDADDFVL